jgi:hypothetical protein
MGGTPTDSTAVAPGRDDGESGQRLSRSGSRHPILRLWIPGMDPARRAAEFCPDRNPGPDDLGRSGLQARDGAHSRAQETVRPGRFCGSHCPVARRGRAAGKMIVGHRGFCTPEQLLDRDRRPRQSSARHVAYWDQHEGASMKERLDAARVQRGGSTSPRRALHQQEPLRVRTLLP